MSDLLDFNWKILDEKVHLVKTALNLNLNRNITVRKSMHSFLLYLEIDKDLTIK